MSDIGGSPCVSWGLLLRLPVSLHQPAGSGCRRNCPRSSPCGPELLICSPNASHPHMTGPARRRSIDKLLEQQEQRCRDVRLGVGRPR